MNQVIVDCSFLPEIGWLNQQTAAEHEVQTDEPVNVYRIRIADHQPAMAAYYSLLSADEVLRAGTYHHRRDCDRFVISRGILRMLLAARIDADAKQIRFEKSAEKKPFQVNAQGIAAKFNVTHAGEMIMIAVSTQDVGADIEFIDPLFGFDEVLDFAFTQSEKEFIRGSSSPRSSFYEIWSRKESLLKATGKGIGNNLATAQCLNGQNYVPVASIGSSSNWSVRSFNAFDGYIGNISFSRSARLRFFDVDQQWFAK